MEPRDSAEHIHRCFHHLTRVEVDILELQLAGAQLGEIQDVVDQGQQRVGAGADVLQHLALVGTEHAVRQHQAAEADNGVERSANFVADVGHELGLQPRRVQGGVARLTQLLFQTLALADIAVADHDYWRTVGVVGERFPGLADSPHAVFSHNPQFALGRTFHHYLGLGAARDFNVIGMDELHAGGADVTFMGAPKLADGIAGEGDGPVGL